MILHNNIVTFFAPSRNSYRGRASPLDNITQTTHNSEFIINNDRKSSVPLDNITRTIHNSEFINFCGASDGGKRMNGGLLSVVERDARPPISLQNHKKRVQIDVIHAIRTPSTLHLHLIYIASTLTV